MLLQLVLLDAATNNKYYGFGFFSKLFSSVSSKLIEIKRKEKEAKHNTKNFFFALFFLLVYLFILTQTI